MTEPFWVEGVDTVSVYDDTKKEYIFYWVNHKGIKFGGNVLGVQKGYMQLERGGYSVIVPQRGLYEWKIEKRLIQEVFPELSDTDREFLITGMTPEQQKELYGGED